MPRFEKWLVGVSADSRTDEAAREAIRTRLDAVRHFLDEAVAGRDEAEGVHQLRIWTRRASAALRLFKPALPNGRRQWLKKHLRRVRRAAGDVRDCDVHLERLEQQES